MITNDIYTKEDAEILSRLQALPLERIMGVETGGCPHTAIREDCSINLHAIAEMRKRFPALELILIESGGDNLAATFSPDLADLTIYVIDVAQARKSRARAAPALPARIYWSSTRPISRRMSVPTSMSWRGMPRRNVASGPLSSRI